MYPTLEALRQLRKDNTFRRFPVCREMYSDRYTPVEVMRILRKESRHCYLLESAARPSSGDDIYFLDTIHPWRSLVPTGRCGSERPIWEAGQRKNFGQLITRVRCFVRLLMRTGHRNFRGFQHLPAGWSDISPTIKSNTANQSFAFPMRRKPISGIWI